MSMQCSSVDTLRRQKNEIGSGKKMDEAAHDQNTPNQCATFQQQASDFLAIGESRIMQRSPSLPASIRVRAMRQQPFNRR